VTHEDVCRCFHGDTMLTVQAPSGTQLEVPIPDSVRIRRNLPLTDFLLYDTMLTRYMLLLCVCLSVCLSVHLSVTCQYCIKMAKHRIMQVMPHDISDTSFRMPKISSNWEGVTPNFGDKCRWGRLK